LPKYAFYLIFIPQEFYSLIHVQGAPECDSPFLRGLGACPAGFAGGFFFKKKQKKDSPFRESLFKMSG
jgi:hypothetical protein